MSGGGIGSLCGKGSGALYREGSRSGGSKGGREGRTPPPLHPNSFNFMQFLGELGKIVCSRPPLGGFTPPPWGNPGSVTESGPVQ